MNILIVFILGLFYEWSDNEHSCTNLFMDITHFNSNLAYPIVILICISLMINDIVLVNYDWLINNLNIASGVQQ